MRYEVLIADKAERDLESIHEYIVATDSREHADRVLDDLLNVVEKLERLPDRGTYPRELVALGYRQYRQILFKPWRLIYRVAGNRVYVHLIADGRRDMRTLLAQRLLGA